MDHEPDRQTVTDLLIAWNQGDGDALAALMPQVTGEMRQIADRLMRRESAGHTLQPTALVHEAYLRLVDRRRVSWQNRAHFFAFAARTMRRVLVDHARQRNAAKRGAGVGPATLTEVPGDFFGAGGGPHPVDLIALDEALDALAERSEPQAEVVVMRFFGGLTTDETAEVTGLSRATVTRYWALARAFLHRELTGGEAAD